MNPSANPSPYARAGVPVPLPVPISSAARDRTEGPGRAERLSDIDRWDALAVVVGALRPDWTPDRIRAVLVDDRRPPREVVQAAIRAALDPDVRTPGGITWTTVTSTTPTPPALRGEQCPDHLGELAASCRGCRADRLAQEGR